VERELTKRLFLQPAKEYQDFIENEIVWLSFRLLNKNEMEFLNEA
jgi:hypothetical protein